MSPAPHVDVLVLGPVRARVAGAESVPGGRRERGVLAALAMAGPAGIDHDRLVDQLWGPAAPPTAHRTAQAYLSRLRSLLGSDVVRTEAGRHRLDACLVDLWEFDALVRRARETPASAPRCLQDALDLWRDTEVAGDAALDGAVDLVAGIRRSRLDALELRLLHVDDAEAVGLAEALIREDPHRERAWAALASALYRLGRQSDALAAIRRAREQLVEDLGVDLSPELERLEQQLLHHSLALGAVPSLPTPLTTLVGRERLVDLVVRSLGSGRLVTLVGTGGIGKTRLALAAATSAKESGSVAVFLADLSLATSARSVDDVLVEAIDAAGEEVEPAFRRRFGKMPGLLVLDNCEHVVAAAAGRVDTLLRGSAGLRVLATSRVPLDVVGERLVEVPPLETSPADGSDGDLSPALRLFTDRATEVTEVSAWSGRELAAATEICRRLDGLPLALELSARRLRTLRVEDLLESLTVAPSSEVDGAGRLDHGLATALDASYDALTGEQQGAFACLGLLQGPVPLATAAAIAGDEASVEALLHASMLVSSPEGVTMYQPVRQYAASKLSPAEREDGRRRIAEEIRKLTDLAVDKLVGPDEVEWIGRIDAVHGDVRSVLEWADRERPDLVPPITADVAFLWALGWSSREGRRWLARALEHRTDDATRVRLLTWSAVLGVLRGEPAGARKDADEAVEIARRVGGTRLLGAALHARALSDKLGDRTGLARQLFEEAWVLRRDAGDLAGAAMSLGAIADIDVNEGHLGDAAERYAVGLPLMRAASTTRGLVAYLHSMSELALMSRDPGRAVSLADEAEAGARATGDVWHLALLASVRACAGRDLGRPAAEQRELNRSALEAATDQPDPHVVLDVVEHIGGWLVDLGRYDEALRLLRTARAVRERAGVDCSRPRRARRDADEAAAAERAQSPGPTLDLDLEWLVAAATDAVAQEPGSSPR